MTDQADVAAILIDAGADVNLANDYSTPPLHRSISNGSHKMTQLLVSASAMLEAWDGNGDQPLELALINNRPEAIWLLLDFGVLLSPARVARGVTLAPGLPKGHRNAAAVVLAESFERQVAGWTLPVHSLYPRLSRATVLMLIAVWARMAQKAAAACGDDNKLCLHMPFELWLMVLERLTGAALVEMGASSQAALRSSSLADTTSTDGEDDDGPDSISDDDSHRC
jgi:hypothetical protein